MSKRQMHFGVILLLTLTCTALARERCEKVLYRFQPGASGYNPVSNLIADQSGNLYGTTEYGAQYYGTVFKLTRPTRLFEPWTQTDLYVFRNQGDGARPRAGLVFDRQGNLYGTTSDSAAGGYGEVFELSPPSVAADYWTETVLYSFQGGTDGAYPNGGLIFDDGGNLYGATTTSVFELSPSHDGKWNLQVLHNFKCCTSDGWNALSGLVRDGQGNLYGTTENGGSYTGQYCPYEGCGTVYEVSPPSAPGGGWSEKVLHAFTQGDGMNPISAVTLDRDGNLYGTTYGGGNGNGGIAFKLKPPSGPDGGDWTLSVLHYFSYNNDDGAAPVAGMIFDDRGNLYGITEFGGNPCVFNGAAYGCGLVFELSPPQQGGLWDENILYFFTTGTNTAKQPAASLYLDHGNLFGTTAYGGYETCPGDGSSGCGTVFEILR